MAKNTPASLGEKLKFIREEANLTLAELSESTKIQKKYLERLENQELEKLPSSVYVKGFIQKWAHACNVEDQDLLLQFYRENKFLNGNLQDEKIERVSAPSFVITLNHFMAVFSIIIVVGLAGYFYYNQILSLNMPEVEILFPREFSSVSSDEAVMIKGVSNGADKIYVNDNEIVIDSGGEFSYNYYLRAGLNTIIITAQGSNSDDEVEVVRKVLKLE